MLRQRPRSRLVRRYQTTIGRKAVLAVTGTVFLLFLVAHMIGNLKIFLGPADYNGYAAWLRTAGAPALPHRAMLTGLEVILAVSTVLHVGAAAELALRARRAQSPRSPRSPRYAGGRPPQGYASRTLRTGAVLIVIFVAYHLLDLTARVLNPKGIAGDPYDNVVADFSNPFITAFYVVSLLVLGLHIRHGVSGALRTLGWSSARRQQAAEVAAAVFASILIGGFLAVPFGVVIGVIH